MVGFPRARAGAVAGGPALRARTRGADAVGTERGIQRVRWGALAIRVLQVLVEPGPSPAAAWTATAVLAVSAVVVEALLAVHRRHGRARTVATAGAVSMALDALAATIALGGVVLDATDPVPPAVVLLGVEAAVRWGVRGGVVGGLGAGVLAGAARIVESGDGAAALRALQPLTVVLVSWSVGHFVTRLRDAQTALRDLAERDPLTGLLHREGLRAAVDDAVHLRRTAAALFIDLDGFKDVNDELGHAAGDRVLIEVAARLRAAVRSSDVVARVGGDEFCVLLDHLDDPCDVEQLIGRVRAALARPVDVHGDAVSIGGSVGIAIADPGDPLDALVARADAAMYRDKEAGRRSRHDAEAVRVVLAGAPRHRR